MRHKNSLDLFAYWNRRRGDRPAPTRSDIEPSDIRRLLPSVFICEVAKGDEMMFRLAGTGVCSLMGKELKGSPLTALWFRDGRRNANRAALAVAFRAAPVVKSLEGLSKGGRVLQAELLMLPVTGPSGLHDRLVGVLSAIDPPFWTGHDPVVSFSTTGIRFLDPARDPLFLANRPEVELPRYPARPADPVPFGRRRVRHLTVLDGGLSK